MVHSVGFSVVTSVPVTTRSQSNPYVMATYVVPENVLPLAEAPPKTPAARLMMLSVVAVTHAIARSPALFL